MQTSSQPKLLPIPFADTGSKQSIPNTSQIGITAGRASYPDGFPPLTRTPLAAGGVPPFGTDFNGVLNDITSAIRWTQAGAGYPFDATFNAAVSGYPKGARVTNSSQDGFWLNTTDGNTTNPENTTSALTGWVPQNSYGTTNIPGLSGSSVTLTTLQASKDRIVLSGTLTTNINLVVPAWIKKWEVINNCTGTYSVTVKTISGTGIAVPAGSTAILLGDGTNIVQAAPSGSLLNVQVFYTSGTYTATIGTKKVIVEMVGGGGGSAGSRAADTGNISVGGAGGAGSYAKGQFTQNFNGVQVVVGSKGAGGTTTGPYATIGGTSSFGSLLSAAGGSSGQPAGPTNSFPFSTVAAVVSSGATGANIVGTPGQAASASIVVSASVVVESPGGSSQFGAGGFITAFNSKGVNGSGYGAGGGPSKVNGGNAAVAGGDGSQGLVIVWEYA